MRGRGPRSDGHGAAAGARLAALRRFAATVPLPTYAFRQRSAAHPRRSGAEAAAAPRRLSVGLIVLSHALIVLILLLDWWTPPGMVVAILLFVPFMLLALGDDARQLWIAGAVALCGRFADMALGAAPTIPKSVWLPNRVLTTVGIISSIVIAHLLLRQRALAQRARDAALDARDMNRLLVSLMAHDLRTPLVVANDALAYAERAAAGDLPVDTVLLGDARARLQRSLRTVESILMVARGELSDGDARRGAEARTQAPVRAAVSSEVASFAAEAAARGKPLVARFDLPDANEANEYVVDALVLRQSLAILLDNAIRYADPGTIHIDVSASKGEVFVRVGDAGPGLSASRSPAGTALSGGGSGLGLELCRALIGRAGGRLELERDGSAGTAFVLRLPARSA